MQSLELLAIWMCAIICAIYTKETTNSYIWLHFYPPHSLWKKRRLNLSVDKYQLTNGKHELFSLLNTRGKIDENIV